MIRGFVLWCERQGLGAATIRQYVRRVADFDEWLGEHGRPSIKNATWRDIRKYAETLKNTHSTRNVCRCSFMAFYRHLGHRDGKNAWAVPVPRRKRGVYRGFATDEEKDRLLDAARSMGATEYAMCCALYYQGLRREEASKIRWAEVRNGAIVGIGKGNAAFELPLHEKFADALSALIPDGPWVFSGRTPGTHVAPNTVWMTVRLAGERAGLGRVTPHMLRHTSGAVVCDTVGLRAAQDFLRHVDIQTTIIYTRTKKARLVAGMAAL